MAYVLEKISEADQEKILTDANCDQDKLNKLNRNRHFKDSCRTWAVDRERNYYMFSAPITTREQTTDRPYYIYFKNVFYEICTEGWFGNRVYFDENSRPSSESFSELEKEVKTAFAVYGRYGDGPLNERGDPEFAITPEFKERA